MYENIKILCITRKYPPKVGGMENFSFNLLTRLEKKNLNTKIISLGKSQFHLIWFFPYMCVYILLNAKKYDVIFIGDAVLCFLGTLAKLVSPNTKTMVNVFGLDITFPNKIYQLYLKLFYPKAFDLYVSISQETDKTVKKLGINKSIIITPGIDAQIIKRNKDIQTEFKIKYAIPEENLIMLTVGRLVKRKGVEWFLRNVMPEMKGHKITYFIIGTGEDKANIEAAIQEYDLADQVKLMGRVEQTILDEFYLNADLFIMPNIKVENDMEGFGIVALEASLSQQIVVASNIEGIKDAIIDNKNGYLIESENSLAFINKLTLILNNWSNYTNKKVIFSNYTKENYNWDFICEKYIKTIQELIKKSQHY